MPAIATNDAPSTLAGVLRQVEDVFRLIGDPTPIMVGKAYLKTFGTGSPPRVLFVPEPGGAAKPPIEMGYAAMFEHTCSVYVRGAEDGSDLGRFDSAYDLADLVIDIVGTACTGRIAWGSLKDSSPTDVDAYGAEVTFSFSYWRDVRHEPARRLLAPATADTSPDFSPDNPQAVAGTEPTKFVVTTNASLPG